MGVTCNRAMRFGAVGLTLAVSLLAGCAGQKLQQRIVEPLEIAHGIAQLSNTRALAFDVEAELGLSSPWKAHMVCQTNGPRVRAELPDGTSVVFDGRDTWVASDSGQVDRAACNLRKWSLDALLPLRLHDPGVRATWLGEWTIRDQALPAARIVDKSIRTNGKTDARIVYVDSQTGRIAAVANECEADGELPYAITFTDFATIDGVTLGTQWQFWPWSRESGPHGDYIGVASLSNLAFVKPDAGTFAIPPNAQRLVMSDDLPTE